MTQIDDVVAGGWWPLRHQATVDAALRYVRMACLVRADAGDATVGKLTFGRDQLGTIREVDGSAGDVQCGLLWEAKNPVVPFDRAQLNDQTGDPPARDFPSLGFVFPAIVRESNPLPRSSESGVPDQTQEKPSAPTPGPSVRGGGGGGTEGHSGLPPIVYQGRGGASSTGQTQTKPAAPPPPPSVPPPPPTNTHVKVLPIQDEKLTPDARYVELTANTEHGVPTDMPGVVVAATHERRMIPLFFPAHWPLKAVNRNDPANRASLVFDLDDKGKVDPSIYARLHSAWRVIRLKTVTNNAAPMLNAAANSGQLAWQLAGAGKDGLAGYGLAYDNTGGAPGSAPPPPDGTTGTATGASGRTGAATSGPTQPTAPYNPGDEFSFGHRPPTALLPKNTTGGSGVGTGTTDGGAGHGTPPGPETTREKRKYPGVIAAYSHTVAAGPFDSGGDGCVHKLGETQDGELVYSGHLHTDSYFRNSSFDGPLYFESRAQGKVGNGPFQMACHLVWNPNLQHAHPSGTKNGKWWWYAESFDYTVASTPVQGAERTSTRVATGAPTGPTRFPNTWPPTGVPQMPDANTTPALFEHPGGVASANRVGLVATSVFTNRNLVANDPKGKTWRASTLLSVGPGFIFRPQDPTPGAPDLRTIKTGAGPLSPDVIRTADLAPTTLRLEAFARRQRANWLTGIGKNVSEFAGGTADIGGLWIGPADRDIQNEMSGQPYVHAPAMDPYFMFHPSVNVGTGGFLQDRYGEGSIDFAAFNPAVFMPAATASGFVPRSDGAGSYAWAANSGAASYNNATTAVGSDITTTDTVVVKSAPIPADTIKVGTTARFVMNGYCRSTVAQNVTFTVRLGTAGTTADASVSSFNIPATAGTGGAVDFRLVVEYVFTAIGGGTSCQGRLMFQLNNLSATDGIFAGTVDLGSNASGGSSSTAASYLSITCKTAGVTTTVTSEPPCLVEFVKI